MRLLLVAGVVATALAGCQTVEESAMSASMTCQEAGLRPGSKAYGRCTNATFRENRRQADQAASAVAVGAAAGLVGGAIIGASAAPRYYCSGWGCW
jgi:hypothetical protein